MALPHILLIVTDQQRHDALSCAGHGFLDTPNLDALAARGRRFTRAYCTHPLCTPSRHSIYSGHLPHETGAVNNTGGQRFYDHARADTRWLGQLLADAGYTSVYAGKDSFPDGFGISSLCDYTSDTDTTDALLAFLRDRPEGPFCAAINYLNPHAICEFARGQRPPEPLPPLPTDNELPPLPANFAPGGCEPSLIRQLQTSNPKVYPGYHYDDRAWRQYRWAYARLVEQVDHEVGRLLAGLEEHGLSNNTLIIFTSDHGDGDASHRWNQKTILYEEMIRVPFLAAGPAWIAPGESDALVSLLDLVPTLCRVAGVTSPAYASGRDLRPLLRAEPGARGHDELVVQTTLTPAPGATAFGRALVTPRHKFISYSYGAYREQLFDLQTDPGEQQNLVVCGAYQEITDSLRDRLAAHCVATDDPYARFI